LSADDSETSKALQCKHKLQELNHYVKVTVVRDERLKTALDYLKEQKQKTQENFKVVVMTDLPNTKQAEVLETSKFCRGEKIPFIYAVVAGCSAKILTDFGESFKILE
jgi:2-phospho-L-lactate guanylyltransferase (CobY/MobA/RfbA family)